MEFALQRDCQLAPTVGNLGSHQAFPILAELLKVPNKDSEDPVAILGITKDLRISQGIPWKSRCSPVIPELMGRMGSARAARPTTIITTIQ